MCFFLLLQGMKVATSAMWKQGMYWVLWDTHFYLSQWFLLFWNQLSTMAIRSKRIIHLNAYLNLWANHLAQIMLVGNAMKFHVLFFPMKVVWHISLRPFHILVVIFWILNLPTSFSNFHNFNFAVNFWFYSLGFTFQMTKLAIIPCTVLLETLFFRKRFR